MITKKCKLTVTFFMNHNSYQWGTRISFLVGINLTKFYGINKISLCRYSIPI